MFSIEMLPANEGDALWVEYGNPDKPSRILIDCGYKSTYRAIMKRLRERPEIEFELLVLTHIDGDHIAGAVPFIADGDITPQRIKEVWFNDHKHISDTLGVRQALYLTRNLEDKQFAWNKRFGERAIHVPEDRLLPPIHLEGGLVITLLSPTAVQLAALAQHWEKELDDILDGKTEEEVTQTTPGALQPDVLGDPDVNQLARTPFKDDTTVPNGSSIAFLAEYEDSHDSQRVKRVLFCGDAHAGVLEHSISLLLAERGIDQLSLDALKVSHHGSKANTSPKMLDLIQCKHFLFSTNGSRHDHPDPECIARIITHSNRKIDLHFNYRSEENAPWQSPGLARKFKYDAHYPETGKNGLVVIL